MGTTRPISCLFLPVMFEFSPNSSVFLFFSLLFLLDLPGFESIDNELSLEMLVFGKFLLLCMCKTNDAELSIRIFLLVNLLKKAETIYFSAVRIFLYLKFMFLSKRTFPFCI